MNELLTFAHTQGFLFIFAVILSSLVAEDITGIAVGILIAQGAVNFWAGVAAFFFGIYLGDIALYLIGRGIGLAALERIPLRWIVSLQDVDRCRQWFSHRGPIIIFVSRFVPGMRLPVFVSAGLSKVSLGLFGGWLLIAVAVWSPLIIGGSVLFGHQIMAYFSFFQKYAMLSFVVLLFVIFVILHILIPLMSFRGRRYLVSRFKRIWHWEYWPMAVFYFPVVCYVLYLGIRYRSLTLFTAGNPGIEAGGFVGESKFEILKNLDDFGKFVARSALIKEPQTLPEKIKSIDFFLKTNDLNFPIVLKPDAGQRGEDVNVVDGWDDVTTYLSQARGDIIAQEYVSGAEFGVFYYRFPNEEKGKIFAITEKKFPYVKGDGKNTLEHLILSDPRAVCMADAYFEKQLKNLWNVPALGESVQLTHIGSHCRGTIFYDGSWIKTPALEEAIDRLSRRFGGFYFGRYDIRVGSIEEFKQGLGFKVLELNGVTAEATSIYDPRYSVFQAYRILFEQWLILFKIADINKSNGARVFSFNELSHLIFNYYCKTSKSMTRESQVFG